MLYASLQTFKHTMSSVCSHILCAFFTAIQITLLDTKTPLCPQDKYHSSIFFIALLLIIAVVLSPLISGVGPCWTWLDVCCSAYLGITIVHKISSWGEKEEPCHFHIILITRLVLMNIVHCTILCNNGFTSMPSIQTTA